MKRGKYKVKVSTRIKHYGDCDDKKKLIRINPKKGDTLDTFLHECLHALYPEWTEREVSKETAAIEATVGKNKKNGAKQVKILRELAIDLIYAKRFPGISKRKSII